MDDAIERAAKVADKHADGRMMQYFSSKAAGLKTEARDYQTMAMAARQIANDIRELAKVEAAS